MRKSANKAAFLQCHQTNCTTTLCWKFYPSAV